MKPGVPNIVDILINILQSLIAQLVAFIPNLITALVILLIGVLLARLVATVVQKVLLASGIDKLGEKLNEIDIVRSMNTEIKFSLIISKVLYFFILMVFDSPPQPTPPIASLAIEKKTPSSV